MENRSRIGITLVICGAICIVAALGFAALLAYLLSNSPVHPPSLFAPHSPIEDFAGWFVFLMIPCVLAGIAFVVVGVVKGLPQSSQTNKTPRHPLENCFLPTAFFGTISATLLTVGARRLLGQ